MAFERSSAASESTSLEDDPDIEEVSEDKESESDTEDEEVKTETVSSNQEAQDRVDPSEQELFADSAYEDYYASASIEDLKKTINYLNNIRQQANEVKLLRFVTGRGEAKPGSDPAGIIQKRPGLKDLFAVGSLSNPDENTRYMSDVSAAHDLIEYLVAETEAAIKRKESESEESDEYGPGADRADLPTDTAENPGEVPEQVKEGRYERVKGDEESEAESEDASDSKEASDDEAGEKQEPETDEAGNQEEPGSEDMLDVELQEGPEHPLRKARQKYLKGLRLRGKMMHGEYSAKLFEWSPWHDKRSVTIENEDGSTEELFFGMRNGEDNLDKLRNRYREELLAFQKDKISEFTENLDDDLSKVERDNSIRQFAIDLKTAEMEKKEEAFKHNDESFDDASFRDLYRTDWANKWRSRVSYSLLGAGVLTGGTAGAAVLGARGAVAGVGAAGAAEQGFERVHAGGYNPLSRTGAVADIRSNLEEDPSAEDVSRAIDERFASQRQEGGVNTRQLKEEMARLRMLANDMGAASLDEAVAGSDGITTQIVRQMQGREQNTIGDKSLDFIQRQIENQEKPESDAIADGLEEAFKSEESIIHDNMEDHNDAERLRKMGRRALGAATGVGVGWIVGSGQIGRWIEDIGDYFGGGTPETPPGGSLDMSELPPEMQPQSEAETVFDVEISDWDAGSVAGDETKARSFIEATGDIKSQMQDLDAFDVTGGQGGAINNLQAAENLQDFLGEDIANDLAERLDGYRPEQIKESLVVHPGETLSVTNEGNLVLEQANGDTELLYNGAQDKVNIDTLKDDLFGDFDDTSGPEVTSGADAGADTGAGTGSEQTLASELEQPEVEQMETIDPDADVDISEHITMPEQSEAIQRIRSRPQEANGVLKGAMNSFIDADGNPAYVDSVQLPDGVSSQEFANHIQQLNKTNTPLAKLSEIANNKPEQFRSLQSLVDGYAEFHLDPSSDMGVAETEDLKSLYTALDNYTDQGAPELTPADPLAGNEAQEVASVSDSASSLEEQLEKTPGSVDAQAPEPPTEESAGGEQVITGEGRGADVDQPDSQAGQEVVGEGRGAQVESTDQPQDTTSSQQQQPENTEPNTESENTEPTQSGEGIAVDTGGDALEEANQNIPPQDRVAADGIELANISASEANNINPVSGQSPEEYLGQGVLPEAAINHDSYPPLQDMDSETWTSLVDTFKESASFSEGVNKITELADENAKTQLEALYEAIQADGDGVWGSARSPDEADLKVLQSYISDQYEQVTGGRSIPDALSQ